jgi:hypothetical protein
MPTSAKCYLHPAVHLHALSCARSSVYLIMTPPLENSSVFAIFGYCRTQLLPSLISLNRTFPYVSVHQLTSRPINATTHRTGKHVFPLENYSLVTCLCTSFLLSDCYTQWVVQGVCGENKNEVLPAWLPYRAGRPTPCTAQMLFVVAFEGSDQFRTRRFSIRRRYARAGNHV